MATQFPETPTKFPEMPTWFPEKPIQFPKLDIFEFHCMLKGEIANSKDMAGFRICPMGIYSKHWKIALRTTFYEIVMLLQRSSRGSQSLPVVLHATIPSLPLPFSLFFIWG